MSVLERHIVTPVPEGGPNNGVLAIKPPCDAREKAERSIDQGCQGFAGERGAVL